MKNTNKKTAKSYTRLDCEDIGSIVAEAMNGVNEEIALDIGSRFEVEENEEAPGTFWILYPAKSEAAATIYGALMETAAKKLGFVAKRETKWADNVAAKGRRRFVDVFVSAANFYNMNGVAVA